jgi:anti-anti-sigma regulatory factor
MISKEVKIDTKEAFHVITPVEPHLSANLTDKLSDLMHDLLKKPIKNVVLKAENVESMEEASADRLAELSQTFQAQNASFVICCLQTGPRKQLETRALNITPTESEAWDIVQMEEIERELFGNETENE